MLPVPSTPAFEGFRTGQRATAIPVQFFTELLEQVDDADELRVTLYALYAIPRPGRAHTLRVSALAAERPLARHYGDAAYEAVTLAAWKAVERGTLLALEVATDSDPGDALLFVNNESGRRLRERIALGVEPAPESVRVVHSAFAPSAVAQVYESEIGTLTASVSARLVEAEQAYAADWIADALREAARQNKRSWAYAEAILRRWQAEGRRDEATARDPGRSDDPYEHLYRRD
ncbi:MAG: DnaD domain protein [Chloroflexi bacterium]|nr:DnaD domain protein [Chloroflexota bacterium]